MNRPEDVWRYNFKLWLLLQGRPPAAPRLLAMLLLLTPPRRHGQKPVHDKPSRCPLQLEPVAIEEAMTTDVSKRRYQMVLL